MTSTRPVEASPPPMSALERRYRRWMWVFPADYRVRREDELVGVLLDRAGPGQQRLSAADVADLVRAGVVARAKSFRGSTRERAWGDAGSIIGMFIALALAVQGAVFVTFGFRVLVSEWARSVYDLDRTLLGWQVPAAWLMVVLLLLAGWTRPAMVAAWVAVAVRIVVTIELMEAENTYQASHTMPQLAAAIAGAVLLSRPRRVREVIERLGRGRLALVAVVLAAVQGLQKLRYGDATVYVLGVPLLVVAALAWAAVRRRSARALLNDPVARRVAIGLVALVPIYLASEARPTRPWFTAGVASLVTDVVLCLVLAGVWLLVAAAVPILARRLPFRVVRRTEVLDATDR